jgi:hypothetical protein
MKKTGNNSVGIFLPKSSGHFVNTLSQKKNGDLDIKATHPSYNI